MNCVRIKLSDLDEFLDFRNSDSCGCCHHGIKVPSGFSVNQIAPLVTLPRLYKGKISRQSVLEYVRAPIEFPRLLALRNDRAVAGGCEEPANSCTSRADAFSKGALRNQLNLNFASKHH